ncbi:uncharacterized protein LOC143415673 isoform X2 [Maylandia zebra]|uniref:uncharacterized protein LOC143415673 isoform X2 n=1 Tax=Maylandia zebra TaxID=106582 RepID=UPI00403C6420
MHELFWFTFVKGLIYSGCHFHTAGAQTPTATITRTQCRLFMSVRHDCRCRAVASTSPAAAAQTTPHHRHKRSFVVNVTQTCYQAEENHNITLEWTFTTRPDGSTNSVSIRCQHKTNFKTFGFYHVSNGVEVSASSTVQTQDDDSGLYLCEVLIMVLVMRAVASASQLINVRD